MKKCLILLLSLSLLIGCICGCDRDPGQSAPETTQATGSGETAPSESQPAEGQATAPQATVAHATEPQQGQAPTVPQGSNPQSTQPQETEDTDPPETKPANATVPAAGTVIENLVCSYSIGNGSQKTISNPTASHLYHYIRQARSKAQQETPTTGDSAEAEKTALHLSFKIGEKEIARLDLYADDYASIPLTVELPPAQFYLFASGTYQAILNTLNKH